MTRRLDGRWFTLPAKRQQKLRKGIARLQNMTPEQRQRARRNLKRWQNLTPEQRRTARDKPRRAIKQERAQSSR